MSTAGNTGTRRDPLPVYCFKVEFDELKTTAFFKSVSGLKYEAEVVPYTEGGHNFLTRKLVGPVKWPNIVLKQGFTGSSDLLDWRLKWMQMAGPLTRVTGKIIQLDSAMKPICQWKWDRGWPCKWEGPEFDASKNELAIETLEIAHEGLEYKKL